MVWWEGTPTDPHWFRIVWPGQEWHFSPSNIYCCAIKLARSLSLISDFRQLQSCTLGSTMLPDVYDAANLQKSRSQVRTNICLCLGENEVPLREEIGEDKMKGYVFPDLVDLEYQSGLPTSTLTDTHTHTQQGSCAGLCSKGGFSVS